MTRPKSHEAARRQARRGMTHKLFVYGTLMPRARDRMGQRARACLSASGVWRGTASLKGVLYDLGGYPGLVESMDEAAAVTGALIELAEPRQVFPWLDRYEGVDPRRPGMADYRRVTRDVQGLMGLVKAWVYICPQVPHGARPIAGGDWLEHAASQAAGKPFKP